MSVHFAEGFPVGLTASLYPIQALLFYIPNAAWNTFLCTSQEC